MLGLVPQYLDCSSNLAELIGPVGTGHQDIKLTIADRMHHAGKCQERTQRGTQHQPNADGSNQQHNQCDFGGLPDDRVQNRLNLGTRHADKQYTCRVAITIK